MLFSPSSLRDVSVVAGSAASPAAAPSSGAPVQSTTGSGSAPSFAANPLVTTIRLAGTWTNPTCQAASNYSSLNKVEFASGHAALVVSVYTNSLNCQGSATYNLTFTGNYSLGTASPSVSGATTFTYATNAQVGLTPLAPAIASELNQADFCGITTWQSGITQTIPGNAACISSVPSISQHTVVGIDNNELYFGNDGGTGIVDLPYVYASQKAPDVVVTAPTVASLEGTWRSACLANSSGGGSSWLQYTYDGISSYSLTLQSFANADCSGAVTLVSSVNGKYSGISTNLSIAGTANITQTFTANSGGIPTDTLIHGLSACNTATNLGNFTLACFGASGLPLAIYNAGGGNIFEVSGNTLYLGYSSLGTLNTSLPFTLLSN